MLLRVLFISSLVSCGLFAETAAPEHSLSVVGATPASNALQASMPMPEDDSTQLFDQQTGLPYYQSPSGIFKLPVPVLPELGGRVSDDTLFVHFMDSFTTHITVGVIEMDATFRWEHSIMEPKEFLLNVFNKIVMPQFKAACPTTKADTVLLYPKLKKGALYVGTLHPGNTQFMDRIAFFGKDDNIPTGRRGTLLFSEGEYLFIISSELGERATERSMHTMSDQEENDLLRKRLLKLLKSMKIDTAKK